MKYVEFNKDSFQKPKSKEEDQACQCAIDCGAANIIRTCSTQAHLYCGLRTKEHLTGHCRADGFKPRIPGSWKFNPNTGV